METITKKAEDLQPGDVIVSHHNNCACRDVVYDVRFTRDNAVHVDINDDTGVNVYGFGELVGVALPHPYTQDKAKGRAARLAGATYAANPYPAATLERMAWQQGWTETHAELQANGSRGARA